MILLISLDEFSITFALQAGEHDDMIYLVAMIYNIDLSELICPPQMFL